MINSISQQFSGRERRINPQQATENKRAQQTVGSWLPLRVKKIAVAADAFTPPMKPQYVILMPISSISNPALERIKRQHRLTPWPRPLEAISPPLLDRAPWPPAHPCPQLRATHQTG